MGWTGDDCNLRVLNNSGPCYAHSHPDMYGQCICDSDWSGYHCTVYSGYCDPVCFGCDGASAAECKACVTNAYVDSAGYCRCKDNWGGDGCKVFSGSCHAYCNGCRGSTNYDCNYCIENAEWDIMGRCNCVDNWSGTRCQTYMGMCDSLCYTCNGPTAADCTSCVTNAAKDAFGVCMCNEDYGGQACAEYEGTCDLKCHGCYGPGADMCHVCVPHSETNPDNGHCECKIGWGADDCCEYQGGCDPMCEPEEGCTGETSSDCNFCVTHANLNWQGYCECDVDWSGVSCEKYIGPCHSLCDGCYGPTSGDCNNCRNNAVWNPENYCVCAGGWIGTQCDQYTGLCHPRCDGCVGTSTFDCQDCVANSHRDQNTDECVCDPYWAGNDCSIYLGVCDPMCDQSQGCSGPFNTNCVACNSNAVLETAIMTTHCVCAHNWTGPECQIYTGDCDEKCDQVNGCRDPTAAGCVMCANNAGRNSVGACECLPDWEGHHCEHYGGICAPICRTQDNDAGLSNPNAGCWGPSDTQCKACYSGEYESYIDDSGNTGALFYDEIVVDFANQVCTCSAGWVGPYCNLYTGECPKGCKKCVGDRDEYCVECIDNAYMKADTTWQWDSGCNCLPGFAYELVGGVYTCVFDQSNCSTMCGDGGCSDFSSRNCTDCTSNAFRNAMGYCECTDGYTFSLSNTAIDAQLSTSGGLSGCTATTACTKPYCQQCLASDAACYECISNAWSGQYSDIDGTPITISSSGIDCSCFGGYAGDLCDVYIGACWEGCAACNGPYPDNCIQCAENYVRETNLLLSSYGNCVCNPYYTSSGNPPVACAIPDQQYCQRICEDRHDFLPYSDPWGCTSLDTGCNTHRVMCTGLDERDCVKCGRDSHREHQTGRCVCNDGFQMDHEMRCSYRGSCNPKCASCGGPASSDCYTCVTHATAGNAITVGGVQNADNFDQLGHSAYDADDQAYPSRNNHVYCTCDAGWGGVDCQNWIGACHGYCDGCLGPDNNDCVRCTANASRNSDGDCICNSGWGGADCSFYIGVCDYRCEGGAVDDFVLGQYPNCSGPTNYDCNKCSDNAERDGDNVGKNGACICAPGWSGNDCTQYRGECHNICRGNCTGPTAYDCTACDTQGHSLENGDGLCQCEALWTGETCELYNGSCDPICIGCSGPTAIDCLRCVPHAGRISGVSMGTCTCNTDYEGDDCHLYVGVCYETCSVCPRGHTIYDCDKCVDHAYMNEFNECVCNKDWSGAADCSVYSGVCAPHCRVCSGPDPNECLDCIETLTPSTTVDGSNVTINVATTMDTDEDVDYWLMPYPTEMYTVIAGDYEMVDNFAVNIHSEQLVKRI